MVGDVKVIDRSGGFWAFVFVRQSKVCARYCASRRVVSLGIFSRGRFMLMQEEFALNGSTRHTVLILMNVEGKPTEAGVRCLVTV